VLERKQAEDAVRQREAMLRLSVARIQDLAGRLITAGEEERRRIARELHDDIIQQLAAVSMALSGLKRRLETDDRATLEASLDALQQRTCAAADSVRRLSHDLHPGLLQQIGLTASLETYCAEFQQRHGIEVTLRVGDGLETITPDVALCLYRGAQEALGNVAKHAGARHAEVLLAEGNTGLTLTIADDGAGFDVARVRCGCGGLGLLSLEERAGLLAGSVRIASSVGRGTKVQINIPTT
jgi:two-component system sensor histidine kinase UhpB